MTDKKILDKFGVTDEQLDKWEKDAAKGIFRKIPTKIEVGCNEPTVPMRDSRSDKLHVN